MANLLDFSKTFCVDADHRGVPRDGFLSRSTRWFPPTLDNQFVRPQASRPCPVQGCVRGCRPCLARRRRNADRRLWVERPRSGCSAPNYSIRGHVPSSSNKAPPASASSATPPRLPQIAFLRRGADPAEANRASMVIGPSASRPRSTFGVAPPRRTYCGSLVVFAESRLQVSPIRRIKDLGHFDIYQTFVTYQWQDWRSRQHAGKVVWCTPA